jgi:hypothetical protein
MLGAEIGASKPSPIPTLFKNDRGDLSADMGITSAINDRLRDCRNPGGRLLRRTGCAGCLGQNLIMYLSRPCVWSIMQNRFNDLRMPKTKKIAVGDFLISKTRIYFFNSIRTPYCALISDDTFIPTFTSEYTPCDKTVFVVLNDFVVRDGKELDLFYQGVRPLFSDIRQTMTGRPAKYFAGRGMRTEYDGALWILAVVYSSGKKDDALRKREKLAHLIPVITTRGYPAINRHSGIVRKIDQSKYVPSRTSAAATVAHKRNALILISLKICRATINRLFR